ncbi:MAG: hypothetical protein AB7G44_15720 [Bacteroidia bacterium]
MSILIPIIFVHRSNSAYLKYTLKQARYFNPETPVYLIGDESNNKYDFITHINIDKYLDSAQKFSEIYVHMSHAPFEFEKFCFERWFIVKDFVTKNNISQFLCLDSDVLLSCNSEYLCNNYSHFKFTVRGKGGAGVNYFSDCKYLIDFCIFITGYYSIPQRFIILENYWTEFKKRGDGGNCDMVLFSLYLEENKDEIGDTGRIKNNEIAEYCLVDLDGIVKNDMIYKKRGSIFFKKKDTQTEIRINAFHVNINKDKIYRYYLGSGLYKEQLLDAFKDLRDKYQLRTRIRNFFNTITKRN